MGDTSDLDQQIEQLRKCEVIKESDVKILCAKAREILGRNSGLLQILQSSFHELSCVFLIESTKTLSWINKHI